MYLKCVKANRPSSVIKEIRAFELPAYRFDKECHDNLVKFLEDYRKGYGGKVYTNNNWALAVITHPMHGKHSKLENVKDFIVIVEYENGQHFILNMDRSEFYSEFDVVKDDKKS